MRKSLFFLALLLAGCGGNSVEPIAVTDAAQPPVQTPPATPVKHEPIIDVLALTPERVPLMEGGGSVVVTAEIAFWDFGSDLQSLWVKLPDGTTVDFPKPIDAQNGALSESFTVSTQVVGAFSFEFWLVDRAGDSSNHVTAVFSVVGDVRNGDWTRRLGGLPYPLNDVTWDGSVFIAVGGNGSILTSADGIDWVPRDSGTDASLGAVAALGSDIFAVGWEIVLHSTDHGETWTAKPAPSHVGLAAVVITPSQVVIAGNVPDVFASLIYVSADRGETWQRAYLDCDWFCGFLQDLHYRNGLFLATAGGVSDRGRSMVSNDGLSWTSSYEYERASMTAIVHDGSTYFVSGGNGALFTTFDGISWTPLQPLVADVDYESGAWSGSKLVFAGGYSWRYYSRLKVPEFEVPVGVSSSDGGATWEVFNIDGLYQSRGMAYGNGRFVSVGQSTPTSYEGAIYTTE